MLKPLNEAMGMLGQEVSGCGAEEMELFTAKGSSLDLASHCSRAGFHPSWCGLHHGLEEKQPWEHAMCALCM